MTYVNESSYRSTFLKNSMTVMSAFSCQFDFQLPNTCKHPTSMKPIGNILHSMVAYLCHIVISSFRLALFRLFVFFAWRYFVFSPGAISSFRRAIKPGIRRKIRNNEMADTSHHSKEVTVVSIMSQSLVYVCVVQHIQ